MNDRFNFGRFGRLYLHDLTQIWKNNGMLILIFALIPAIFYLLYITFGTLFSGDLDLVFTDAFDLSGPPFAVRLGIALFTAGIFVIIFPSRSYGHITDKSRGSAYLMLPASRGEKYTSMMLNCLFVIPVVFLLCYTAVDALVCLMDKSCGISLVQGLFSDQSSWNKEDEVIVCCNGLWIFLVSLLCTGSTFTLGAVLFKKWKVLGMIFWLWVLEMFLATAIGLFINLYDVEDLLDRLREFIAPELPRIDIWINTIINAWIALWLAICGTWTWFKIKKFQH